MVTDRTVVLALDLATLTGYACGRRFDRRPDLRVGTWALPSTVDGTIGQTLSALDRRLAQAIDEWNVEHIVFESPFTAQAQTMNATARVLIALPGIVEKVAHECGVDCSEENLSTARKFVLGRARARWDRDLYQSDRARALALARKATKRMVLDWAASQGLHYIDDNAADAALLHRYATTILTSRRTA